MYLTQLYPTPKTLEAKPGEPFHFGASVRVVLPKNTSLAVIENVKKLWHRFTFTASKLEVITTGQGHFAMFYLPEKTAGIPNSIQPGNYYRIKVDSRAAIVGAVSALTPARSSAVIALMRRSFRVIVSMNFVSMPCSGFFS